jgi:hypothetical protein
MCHDVFASPVAGVTDGGLGAYVAFWPCELGTVFGVFITDFSILTSCACW